MKLREALEIVASFGNARTPAFRVFLACGFTPLDLKTFISAHASLRLGGRPVEVASGLFGDLIGSLDRLQNSADPPCDLVLMALEWQDLDPRLGYRSSGSWEPDKLRDLIPSVASAFGRLLQALTQLRTPVVLCLPTLPLPPMFLEANQSAGMLRLELQAAVANFGRQVSPHVQVVNPHAIDAACPPHQRLDLRTELEAGFPYQRAHAEALAHTLCAVAFPAPTKKGLITDLDGTLWDGIVGEDGVNGVTWDLEHGTFIHGLYQKTLASLATSGALVAIASKNDALLVTAALQRNDLLLPSSALFPIEAHWGPKSDSVRRILARWNIAAEDVVVVDDDPIELAEIQAAHPRITPVRFGKDDPAAALEVLQTLRQLFGKHEIHEEDKIRAASIRPNDSLPVQETFEEFLANARAVLTLDATLPPPDGRALELINKTNQFNLNGKRFTAAEWSAMLGKAGAFLFVVSYEDRYGPLGRIAVLAGEMNEASLQVCVWAMSCRAFSRRIEHHCLQLLFQRFGVNTVSFAFERTERNGPFREFLTSISGAEPVPGQMRVSRESFEERRPALHHRVQEHSHV